MQENSPHNILDAQREKKDESLDLKTSITRAIESGVSDDASAEALMVALREIGNDESDLREFQDVILSIIGDMDKDASIGQWNSLIRDSEKVPTWIKNVWKGNYARIKERYDQETIQHNLSVAENIIKKQIPVVSQEEQSHVEQPSERERVVPKEYSEDSIRQELMETIEADIHNRQSQQVFVNISRRLTHKKDIELLNNILLFTFSSSKMREYDPKEWYDYLSRGNNLGSIPNAMRTLFTTEFSRYIESGSKETPEFTPRPAETEKVEEQIVGQTVEQDDKEAIIQANLVKAREILEKGKKEAQETGYTRVFTSYDAKDFVPTAFVVPASFIKKIQGVINDVIKPAEDALAGNTFDADKIAQAKMEIKSLYNEMFVPMRNIGNLEELKQFVRGLSPTIAQELLTTLTLTESTPQEVTPEQPSTPSVTSPQEQPRLAIETAELTLEQVSAMSEPERKKAKEKAEKILSDFRTQYAQATVNYKNAVRERKGFWKKITDDLREELGLEVTDATTVRKKKKTVQGLELTTTNDVREPRMPEVPYSEDMKRAERNYAQAKKNKAVFTAYELRALQEQGLTESGIPVTEQVFDVRRIYKELGFRSMDEYEKFQKAVIDALPPQEKGFIGKAFAKYAEMPKWKRIALATGTTTGIALLTGSVVPTAAAFFAGGKVARAMVGSTVGQGVGKAVDGIISSRAKKRIDKEKKNFMLEEDEGSPKQIDMDKFLEAEANFVRFLDKEQVKKKKQRLIKGLVVSGVAGVSGMLAEGYVRLHTQDVVDAPVKPTKPGVSTAQKPSPFGTPPEKTPFTFPKPRDIEDYPGSTKTPAQPTKSVWDKIEQPNIKKAAEDATKAWGTDKATAPEVDHSAPNTSPDGPTNPGLKKLFGEKFDSIPKTIQGTRSGFNGDHIQYTVGKEVIAEGYGKDTYLKDLPLKDKFQFGDEYREIRKLYAQEMARQGVIEQVMKSTGIRPLPYKDGVIFLKPTANGTTFETFLNGKVIGRMEINPMGGIKAQIDPNITDSKFIEAFKEAQKHVQNTVASSPEKFSIKK